MTAREELQGLIEQLVYHDNENETEIANEVLDAISFIREEGLTRDEAVELLNDRYELWSLNSVLQDEEQIRIVEAVLHRVPGILFP
jgi:hypothetical protein